MYIKKGVKRSKKGVRSSKKRSQTDQKEARFALPIFTFGPRIGVSGLETVFGRPKTPILGGSAQGRFSKVYNPNRSHPGTAGVPWPDGERRAAGFEQRQLPTAGLTQSRVYILRTSR